MPLSQERLKELEAARGELLNGIENMPEGEEYEQTAASLSKLNSLLDKHYALQRNVDENGQLKSDPKATRLPASSSDDPKAKETGYFFEPSIAEVQDMYRRDPGLIQRLGLSSEWQTGVSVPQMAMPMPDASGHGVAGWNIQPAKSFIDTLTDEQEPYKALADHLWEQKMAEAKERGQVIKRYRDIHLAPGQLEDLVRGGAEWVVDRQLAPAAMGAANAYSLGQAGPLYDSMRELHDYKQTRREPIAPEHQVVTDPMTGQVMGTNESQLAPYDSRDLPPTSRELELRSPLATMAGGMATYGLKGNPANILQEGATKAMGYYSPRLAEMSLKGSVPARAAMSGMSGAGANVIESAVGRASSALSRGEDPLESYGLEEAALDTFLGSSLGALGDVAAQAAGGMRNSYRESRRDLQPLINAGGDTSIIGGVEAPPSVEADLKEASKVRAVGSPGAIAADRLAPKIQQSLLDQQVAEGKRIGEQMEEYYNHPVYGQMRTSAKPLVESLVSLAQHGRVSAPLTGGRVSFNRDNIRKIKQEFGSNWAEVATVPREQAAAYAHQNDGVVIDRDLALELFEKDVPGDMVPIVVVGPMDARSVIAAEEYIDRMLNRARVEGGNQDPVYTALNAAAKKMRDQFPLWRDENGNLVNPPDGGRSQPFDLADDIPRGPGRGTYLAPPTAVGEPSKPPNIVEPGIGPGQGPFLSGDPFDQRLPASRGLLDPAMEPNRQVTFEGSPPEPPYIPAEALPGVGPRYDPRDVGPALPVHGQLDVRGQYKQPPMVRQPDILGVGPRFQPRANGAAVEGQRTASVGTYNEPATVLPGADVGPATDRNPYGFADQGKQNEPESPLAAMAGPITPRRDPGISDEEFNMRQHELDEFIRRDQEMNAPEEEVAAAVEEAPPQRAEPEPAPARQSTPPPEGGSFAIVDRSEGMTREKTFATLEEAKAEAKRLGDKFKSQGRFKVKKIDAPVAAADNRGGLERMLDQQLAEAPPANKAEIEEIGAEQTADREQVAADQKAYVEDNLGPGRKARAAESSKMGKLSVQQEAIEAAMAQVDDINKRLGPLDDQQKRQYIADIVGQKIGRKITVQDLVDAGLLTGGVGALVMDEDNEAGGAAAMFGGGRLFRGKAKAPEAPKQRWPQQPKAKLPDGTEVQGFSAMRRQQHEAKGGIETAQQRVGAQGDQGIRNRIIGFNRGDDIVHDQALLEEAQRIGAEDELWQAAASAGWLDLKSRARGGTKGEGIIGRAYDTLGPRLDALSGYLSGAGRNPLSAGPSDISEELWRMMLADPARRLVNLRGGTLGARYGNDATTIYNLLFGGEEPPEEQQQQ